MDNEIDMYREEGFEGFFTVKQLRENQSLLPARQSGVYILLRESALEPVFLEIGTGGHFKGEDPNVSISKLKEKFVNGSQLMYIGESNNVRRRLTELLQFGAGENVGHRGGRYLWQLADAEDLIVAWFYTPSQKKMEAFMIADYKAKHAGKRPFANLKG